MDDYDEFGNPIGDEQRYLLDQKDLDFPVEEQVSENGDEQDGDEQNGDVSALTQTYGRDVEVLVETNDNQNAEEPLVEVVREHEKGPDYTVFTHLKKHIPTANYNRDYMLGMLEAVEKIRNVAVVGPLHSGKTSLVDLLVIESHGELPHFSRRDRLGWNQMRYMDNTILEIERGLSLKSNGITFLGFDLDNLSFPINLLDAPGHVNFMDELGVCLQAVDCALVCIDVVEGVTYITENLIRYCQRCGLAMVFVLNKLDRLILELKLPPQDAFLKLMHIVNQINHLTATRYSPELGNIVFASAKLGFSFTIQEFVLYYYSSSLPKEKLQGFIGRMWGEVYFEEGKFSHISNFSKEPTFVEFILLPIYKIITHTLSTDNCKELQRVLKNNFGIHLCSSQFLKNDRVPLLNKVLQSIFRKETGLIHALVHNYDPVMTTSIKLSRSLQAPIEDDQIFLAQALKTMDYGGSEWTLIRIYKGELIVGMQVNVLDSDFTAIDNDQDEEDYGQCKIEKLALMGGRYIFPIKRASEGQLILVRGISNAFTKSCTLYLGPNNIKLPLFKVIDYINEPVVRIVIQPLHPKELPKLLSGLNKIGKYYPGVVIKVEESGEHVILGCGELYLDCLLYDLRNNYARIEIKISSPLTVFTESCAGESFAAIPVKSTNGTVSITVSAEPLTPRLVDDLSRGQITPDMLENPKELSKILKMKYHWDSLASRNVWSFGDANVFVDDTLPDETDKKLLSRYKQQLNRGFQWVISEGPLAGEPIHGVHFKLLSAERLDKVSGSGGGQLIPLVRRACYVALLTAEPILLEPIYEVNVIVHLRLLSIIEELFAKRRGARIYKISSIVAAPLMEIRGQLPVIESVGFETDLRLSTNGACICQMYFCKKIWRKVPGDVMDSEAFIPKLKPAPIESLSRDFVMKTRRRKGISNNGFMSNDGPTLAKYVDPELYAKLKQNGLI